MDGAIESVAREGVSGWASDGSSNPVSVTMEVFAVCGGGDLRLVAQSMVIAAHPRNDVVGPHGFFLPFSPTLASTVVTENVRVFEIRISAGETPLLDISGPQPDRYIRVGVLLVPQESVEIWVRFRGIVAGWDRGPQQPPTCYESYPTAIREMIDGADTCRIWYSGHSQDSIFVARRLQPFGLFKTRKDAGGYQRIVDKPPGSATDGLNADCSIVKVPSTGFYHLYFAAPGNIDSIFAAISEDGEEWTLTNTDVNGEWVPARTGRPVITGAPQNCTHPAAFYLTRDWGVLPGQSVICYHGRMPPEGIWIATSTGGLAFSVWPQQLPDPQYVYRSGGGWDMDWDFKFHPRLGRVFGVGATNRDIAPGNEYRASALNFAVSSDGVHFTIVRVSVEALTTNRRACYWGNPGFLTTTEGHLGLSPDAVYFGCGFGAIHDHLEIGKPNGIIEAEDSWDIGSAELCFYEIAHGALAT